MSARDLARFALLYLDGGKWGDRQIVPEQWVKASTRAYSRSGSGSGYGYLWWIGSDRLPPGTFFAAGVGGQLAFAIPAYDLVVVNRAPHVLFGGPSPAQIGRLLRLIFDAAGLGQ